MSKHDLQHTLARPVSLAIGTLVLSAAVVLSGCGDDQAERALAQAEVQLSSINQFGSTPPPSIENRRKIYSSVLSSVSAIGDKAGSGQQAAASLLKARAQAGLAQIQAAEAAGGESAFLADAIAARSVLDKWISQNATAAALEIYDPAQSLAEYDTQIADKSREADQAMAAKVAQEKRVADIQAEAQGVQLQARAARERETQVRARAQGVAAVERSGIIQEAAERRREADQLDRRAAELLAHAAAEAPKVAELELQANRLNTQQALLRQAQSDIRARYEASRQHAAGAREDAKAAGARLAELLTSLGTARDALAPASDDAVSGYAKAVASAKQAASLGRDTKQSSTAAAGSFQQSMADAMATKALGMDRHARLLEAAANVQPPLSGAQFWKEKASAARASSNAIASEVKAAYEAAVGLFESSGGGDKAKGVIDAMKRFLEEREKGAMDTGAVEQEVRGALAGMMSAENSQAALANVVFKNDESKAAVDGLVPITAKLDELRAAAKNTFGKELGELIAQSENPAVRGNPLLAGFAGSGKGGGGLGGGVPGLPSGDASDATVVVEGPSRAMVTMGGQAFEMAKVEGVWKLRLELPKAAIAQMGMMKPMFESMAGVLSEVTEKTSTGGYATADDMLQELASKVAAAAMGGGKPAGDGAGDGAGG